MTNDFGLGNNPSAEAEWPLPGIPAPESEALVPFSTSLTARPDSMAVSPGMRHIDFGAFCRCPIVHIVVLKLDHYGDFIIGLPALRSLREAFPQAMIRLVCGKWNERNARISGLVDEVRCFDFFAEQPAHDGVPAPVPLAPFDQAVEGQWDLAIDLRVDEDTRHLLGRINARLRCGIGSVAHFPLLDIALPHEHPVRAITKGASERFTFLPPEMFNSSLAHKGALHHYGPLVSGEIIKGSFTELPSGRLQVEIGLTVRGHLPGLRPASVLFEVVGENNRLIARRTYGRRAIWRLRQKPVVFEFDNPVGGAIVKLRAVVQGRPSRGTLQFSGATVCQLEAAPAKARYLPAELHIGEKLSLLVSLVRDRTRDLYEVGRPADRERSPWSSGLLRIAIAPFSNSSIRNWPASYYNSLISLLLERLNCEVLLLGTAAQRTQAAAIVGIISSPRLKNMVGRTTWDELGELLQDCDLVICNNSGTAHQAAALGTRVLAIYSGSHQPREWGPRGRQSLVITRAMPCSPCGFESLSQCEAEHACMRQITPDYVLSQVEALLANLINPPQELVSRKPGATSLSKCL